jgi:hypothetical protein
MKNLRTFENFKINEGLITLTDDEIRQLNNLLPKIETALFVDGGRSNPKNFDFDRVPSLDTIFLGSMDIITMDGKQKKIVFDFFSDEEKKLKKNTAAFVNLDTVTIHFDKPINVIQIKINKDHFLELPKDGSKLSPTSMGILKRTLIHEIIHAKDPGTEFGRKKGFSQEYYARDWELKAFGGSFIQQIELAVDNFLRDGIKSQDDLQKVENVLRDFVESHKRGRFPSAQSLEFKLTNNLKDRGFFSRVFHLLKNWRSMDDLSDLKSIKKANPEGYRDFISNLFVRLKRCEEKINKAISDSGLNFKPISITKGKYS